MALGVGGGGEAAAAGNDSCVMTAEGGRVNGLGGWFFILFAFALVIHYFLLIDAVRGGRNMKIAR